MERDQEAVLRLNATSNPEVWPLTGEDLKALLSFEGHHLVAVDASDNVLGYLLSFPRTSSYADSEMEEFRRLLKEPFIYICQVVIASEHRRQGIGRAFYDAVTAEANRTGAKTLCCDVNTNPPNPMSLAFHQKLGFVQLSEGRASNGFGIALLAKQW